jgi:hypothetical protein
VAAAAFARRRPQIATRADSTICCQIIVLSDHPLLIVSLKVPDDLRDHPDKLARNVRDILLCQLPLLLAPSGRGAERRLQLRSSKSKLRPEALCRITQSELAQALLAQALLTKALLTKALLTKALLTKALLAQALAALHGGVL